MSLCLTQINKLFNFLKELIPKLDYVVHKPIKDPKGD